MACIKAIPIMGSNSVNNMALSSPRLCPKMKQLPPIWPIIDALPRICKSLRFFGSIPTHHLDAHILQENRKNLKKCDIRGIVHPPPSSAAAAAQQQQQCRQSRGAALLVPSSHTRPALRKFGVDGCPGSFLQVQQRLLPARRLLHLKKSQRLAK